MSSLQKALTKMANEREKDEKKLEQEAVEGQAKPAARAESSARAEPAAAIAPAPQQTAATPKQAVISVCPDRLREQGVLPVQEEEDGAISDFRKIKRPLLALADDVSLTGGNIIMVASALPGEGKTFCAFNLALSICKNLDHRVLLVDGDLIRPKLSGALGLQSHPGLTDLLVNDKLSVSSVLLRTNMEGLNVIPAGSQMENSTELLSSGRMASIADELSQRYRDRIILFDSPPILATAESQVLAGLAGQIVMVVQSGSTPRDVIAEALNVIGDSKPISLILNRYKMTGLRDKYGSGYGGYGGGYG